MRIKVTIPVKDDSWKISIGNGRPKKKKNAVGVFRHVERHLTRKLLKDSASKVENKIKVVVDYSLLHQIRSVEWTNEGIYAEKNEALYVLVCFLEDFLPDQYLSKKLKIYGEKYMGTSE